MSDRRFNAARFAVLSDVFKGLPLPAGRRGPNGSIDTRNVAKVAAMGATAILALLSIRNKSREVA